jgi:hypothetical protein
MKLSTLARGLMTGVLAALLAAPVNAQVSGVWGTGSEGDNLLFDENGDSNADGTILATLNGQPSYVVTVTSNELIYAQGQGQAFLYADDPKLNNVTFCAPQGEKFWSIIANAQTGTGPLSFTAQYSGPTSGTVTQTIGDMGNGQNFFTIRADEGYGIDCLTLDAPDGYDALKQIRIASGIAPSSTEVSAVVPEPGSIAMLAGMGLGGLVFLRRRARR